MLTKLFRRSRASGAAPRTPRADFLRRSRPSLESLEDRVVMSVTATPIPGFGPALLQSLTSQGPLSQGAQGSPAAITNVSLKNGQLVASGQFEGIPFTAPITLSADPPASAGATPILHLMIGEIHLNVLGLKVDTSNICLNITAQSGPGNLLGNLLGNIANALNGGSMVSSVLGGLSATDANTLNGGVSSLLDSVVRDVAMPSSVASSGPGNILNLSLGPVDLNLLGLNVHLDNCANGPVTVAVSAVPGPGNLLGNLLSDLTNLANITPASITSTAIQDGQLVASGLLGSIPFTAPLTVTGDPPASAGATPILHLMIGEIHLNVLGLKVDTSNICLNVTAQPGTPLGGLLGNIANALNGGQSLSSILAGLSATDANTLTTGVTSLLNSVVQDLTAATSVASSGPGNILNLSLGPVDLNLLGLDVHLGNCANGPVTVAVSAVPGPGNLLGNLLSGLSHTLDQLPASITSVAVQNGQLVASGLLGGIPFTAPLTLGDPSAGTTPVLHLMLNEIHLNLLGLKVDTSNICLNITAQPGTPLGGLLGNIANALNGGQSLSSILAGLSATDLNTLTSGLTTLLNQVFADITSPAAVSGGTGGAAAGTGATTILNLSLGPVELNLLGLDVKLDNCANGPITVTVSAQPGPGNLLGNLLSDVAHLLDNRALVPLGLLSNLLNAAGGGTGTQGFINGLYHSLLGRTGNPAEVAYWLNQIQNGATNDQVVQGFLNSAEFRGDEVDAFYQRFLHRAADPTGRAFWIQQLQSGVSEADVIDGFLNSAEYRAAHASDLAFVNGLYGDVLGRTASVNDLNFWLNQLASGESRQAVENAFVNSNELINNQVEGAYQTFLNRSSDLTGQTFWVNNLLSGTNTVDSLIAGFLTSPEFLGDTQG
jgi:hypothetical protein